MTARPLVGSALGFLGMCVVLWVIGGGVPYGYDGIEIYFTYLIGYNAATFHNVNPLMADIAASPEAAAHPYYYTHHPNLVAHLLTQALIRLGVVDLRAHGLIAILIAAAGIYVGARVVRTMLGEPYAVAYLLVSSLHYVGVLVWTSVLLRSLHFVFFWVAMILVDRYLRQPNSRCLAAIAGWTYVLFLNDYALAPFILIAQAVVVWLGAMSRRSAVKVIAVGCAAAVAAIATWTSILVAELGLNVVKADLFYTYLARNAGQLISDVRTMTDFYRSHRIVFWGVFVESTHLPSLLYQFWKNAFTLGHGAVSVGVYAAAAMIAAGTVLDKTPRLARFLRWESVRPWFAGGAMPPSPCGKIVIVAGVGVSSALAVLLRHKLKTWFPFETSTYLLALGILAALFTMRTATDRLRSDASTSSTRRDIAIWLIAAGGITAWAGAFDALNVARAAAALPDAGFRMAALRDGIIGVAIVGVLTAVAVAGARWVPVDRVVRFVTRAWPAGLFITALLAVSCVATGVVADLSEDLQRGRLSRSGFARDLAILGPVAGIVLLVMCAAIAYYVRRSGASGMSSAPALDRPVDSRPGVSVGDYVTGLVVAIVVMSVLLVGPFASNFVYVYKPVLPFLEDVLLAMALVASLRWLAPTTSYRRTLAGVACGTVLFYWVSYQGSRAYLYPPTELGVARALRGEAFRHSSFVEEAMYAAIWYYTRGVAYSLPPTPAVGGGLDFDSLMFFHDWDVNRDRYRAVQYLACVRQHYQPMYICERWLRRLREVGYELREGENLLYDEDFLIFRLPPPNGPQKQ